MYEALGAPVPTFAHLSMILGADGKKLSKRHGATIGGGVPRRRLSVRRLRELSWRCSAGALDGETTIIDRETLCAKFSLDRITKKDAIFDQTKLEWMNGQYIQRMGADEWVAASRPWLVQAGASEADIDARPEWYAKLYPLVSERLQRLDEVPAKLAYMFWGANVAELDEKSVKKVLLKEGARADEALRQLPRHPGRRVSRLGSSRPCRPPAASWATAWT